MNKILNSIFLLFVLSLRILAIYPFLFLLCRFYSLNWIEYNICESFIQLCYSLLYDFFTISKAFHKHKHTRITVYFIFFIQKLKISFSSLVLYLILFYSSHLNVKLIKYLWTISHRLCTKHWCLLCWHSVPTITWLSTPALSSLITGSLAHCKLGAEQNNIAWQDRK